MKTGEGSPLLTTPRVIHRARVCLYWQNTKSYYTKNCMKNTTNKTTKKTTKELPKRVKKVSMDDIKNKVNHGVDVYEITLTPRRESAKDVIYQFIISILIASLVAVILVWSGNKDKKTLANADKYEACVAEQFNTTPSEYYQKYGTYPICG